MRIDVSYKPRRRYGVLSFLGDILGLLVFNVFWLVWIFVREMRRR